MLIQIGLIEAKHERAASAFPLSGILGDQGVSFKGGLTKVVTAFFSPHSLFRSNGEEDFFELTLAEDAAILRGHQPPPFSIM